MKVIVDIPEIPKNDKQRWALANGTPYEERPHGEWIPYPERLPEERQVVLVTLNPTVIKDATHPVIIARYTTEKDSWIHTIPDAVLAWMPLPEPYKKEGET